MPNVSPVKYTDHVGFRIEHKTRLKLNKISEKERLSITELMRKQLDGLLK